MTRDEILSAIATIVAEKFGHVGPLTADSVATDVDGWDSTAHVELMIDIEDHFGIRLTTGEMANLFNLGALAGAVERRLSRQDP